MKVSECIVEFLIEKGIKDVFGYPGGMVTHLMDAFYKHRDEIQAHVNYHEQASSFCACGNSISGKPGVAYATSGPGATNLITGICNAFYDSTPTIFLTGQVNTYESKGELSVRQKGFQETDIVPMVSGVTKYATLIKDAKEIRYHLEKAYFLCSQGRPGPVLLDIPMNIQREEVEWEQLSSYQEEIEMAYDIEEKANFIVSSLKRAERPCFLVGAGIRDSGVLGEFRELIDQLYIPVITSMVGIDVLPTCNRKKYGFIGAYGDRTANFILAKCDLVVTMGTRLDGRQISLNGKTLKKETALIRIDIDEGEIQNTVKENETKIVADLKMLIPHLRDGVLKDSIVRSEKWLSTCNAIKEQLVDVDSQSANYIVKKISKVIPDNTVICTDVGQNQVWVAQSFEIKPNQRLLFSGGHGAMGFSLPAAIGAYYACKQPVVSFNGDGGIQMNLQELQFIAREKIPIKIIILNNKSLGMIRHFQGMYFDSIYTQTKENWGYLAPDFRKIAMAFDLDYVKIQKLEDVENEKSLLINAFPAIMEISLEEDTFLFPKLAMGRPNYDQDPLLSRELLEKIMEL